LLIAQGTWGRRGTLLQQVPALAATADQHLLPCGQARQGHRPFMRLAAGHPFVRSSRRPPISQGCWPMRNRAHCPMMLDDPTNTCCSCSLLALFLDWRARLLLWPPLSVGNLARSASRARPLPVGQVVFGRTPFSALTSFARWLPSVPTAHCSGCSFAAVRPSVPTLAERSVEMSMHLRQLSG